MKNDGIWLDFDKRYDIGKSQTIKNPEKQCYIIVYECLLNGVRQGFVGIAVGNGAVKPKELSITQAIAYNEAVQAYKLFCAESNKKQVGI